MIGRARRHLAGGGRWSGATSNGLIPEAMDRKAGMGIRMSGVVGRRAPGAFSRHKLFDTLRRRAGEELQHAEQRPYPMKVFYN